MKKDIRNNELRKRTEYIPADVEVISVSAQKVICTSVGDPWDESSEEGL